MTAIAAPPDASGSASDLKFDASASTTAIVIDAEQRCSAMSSGRLILNCLKGTRTLKAGVVVYVVVSTGGASASLRSASNLYIVGSCSFLGASRSPSGLTEWSFESFHEYAEAAIVSVKSRIDRSGDGQVIGWITLLQLEQDSAPPPEPPLPEMEEAETNSKQEPALAAPPPEPSPSPSNMAEAEATSVPEVDALSEQNGGAGAAGAAVAAVAAVAADVSAVDMALDVAAPCEVSLPPPTPPTVETDAADVAPAPEIPATPSESGTQQAKRRRLRQIPMDPSSASSPHLLGDAHGSRVQVTKEVKLEQLEKLAPNELNSPRSAASVVVDPHVVNSVADMYDWYKHVPTILAKVSASCREAAGSHEACRPAGPASALGYSLAHELGQQLHNGVSHSSSFGGIGATDVAGDLIAEGVYMSEKRLWNANCRVGTKPTRTRK
jgi:hypothetical protein